MDADSGSSTRSTMGTSARNNALKSFIFSYNLLADTNIRFGSYCVICFARACVTTRYSILISGRESGRSMSSCTTGRAM